MGGNGSSEDWRREVKALSPAPFLFWCCVHGCGCIRVPLWLGVLPPWSPSPWASGNRTVFSPCSLRLRGDTGFLLLLASGSFRLSVGSFHLGCTSLCIPFIEIFLIEPLVCDLPPSGALSGTCLKRLGNSTLGMKHFVLETWLLLCWSLAHSRDNSPGHEQEHIGTLYNHRVEKL